MKIIEETKECEFETVSIGGVFMLDGYYYMKTVNHKDINCVNLETGILNFVSKNATVNPVSVELVIRFN